MLNFNVENFKSYLAQCGHVILPAKSLHDQLGEKNFKWISDKNILKEIHKEDVHNVSIEFPYGEDGEREEVIVFWESDKYVIEPSAENLPILKIDNLPEKIFKISSVDFVKIVAVANGFSHVQPAFPVQSGFQFIGTRELGSKEVSLLLFTGDSNLDFERVSAQIKIAQGYKPSSLYIVLVFTEGSLREVPNELNFSMSPLRSNLLVSPEAYRRHGISVQNIIGQIKYPVFIDHENELIYIFGEKLTKRSGTILFKYVRDFLLQTQSSAISYLQFCQSFCNTNANGEVNGEPSKVINDRKKEIIENLKKIFSEGSPEYTFAYTGFFSYSEGYLKSHFTFDDIFEYQGK